MNTLADLLAFQPGPLRQAVRAWEVLAEHLDRATGDLARASKIIREHWPSGSAGSAALIRAEALVRETNNAYNPARRIVAALEAFIAGMLTLRSAAARADGRLGPDARHLVLRAAELEAQCAQTVRQNLPDPRTGFVAAAVARITPADMTALAARAPSGVARWWFGLSPLQQDQALADFPDVIGRLDGVPAADRDRANRANLTMLTSQLEARASQLRAELDKLRSGSVGLGRSAAIEVAALAADLRVVEGSLEGLGQVRGQLGRLGSEGFLLRVEAAGDGLAVIAIGNPDAARHTAVWVPGVSTDLGDTAGNLDRVSNLQRAADQLTAAPNDVAGVMWLGYDAPELNGSAVFENRSADGGRQLDSFVDGLNAAHDSTASHVTAVAHSYGSVVVADAAINGNGLGAQDIVAVGSPGMKVDEAKDLHLDPRHVWVGAAKDDAVTWPLGLFGHGPDPTQRAFGANQFLVDTGGHSAYWTQGSVSLENQARIVVSDYRAVTLDHGRPP